MRTYSARQLSFVITLLLSALVGALVFISYVIDKLSFAIMIAIPVFGVATYFLVIYILNHYIYYKILPIYKTIKTGSLDDKKKLDRNEAGMDIISAVKKEVENWALDKEKEIARLKDLERYRKEFVGNVSHELKTPIFNIQGYILTLLEGGLEDSKVNRFYLERTEKSIDRMISIVEDLESITKLESGELKLQMENFNLVKLVEEAFDIEHMIAKQSKISLSIYTGGDKPVMVHADRKRIFEILHNLITNAIKYGRKNGYVKVGFFDMEEHVLVEVTDNGIGIAEEHLPRVFERFYRVDKSRSREQGGTGLGLSIVKHVIEAHKQTINVKSVPEEGTTFTFTLDKVKAK